MERVELPESVTQQIDHWLAKYPEDQRQSAVMAALHIVQDDMGGHLTPELIQAVADYIGMPVIAVQEVATFYSMYEHKPVGKHKISLCTNLSCKLRGADDIAAHLKKRLGVGFGETTQDGLVTLKHVECLGACVGAPMCQVDKEYHENLTPEKIDALIAEMEANHGK